mgnify:CR=1 FL=1
MKATTRSRVSSEEQRSFEFAQDDGVNVVPSPKRKASRTIARRHLPWETNYAAYSIDFAVAAVRELSRSSHARIYDPFVGSGTTLEACASLGISSVGIELNPYSALLSRCRVALRADLPFVRRLLRDADRSIAADHAISAGGQVKYVLRRLSRKLNCEVGAVLSLLCRDAHGDFDSEVVALVAALHAQKQRAQVHFRSNPAWLIAGESPDGGASEEHPWIFQALNIMDSLLSDLASRSAVKRPSSEVFATAFQAAPIRRGSIKRFLTSPPYLNRLDYINPTVPELTALGYEATGDLDRLRVAMMGTNKMRRRELDYQGVSSKAASAFLEEVSSHSSKASATYYKKFFQQYFMDLNEFMRWLDFHASTDARGILVIQDSFYKEIKIPIVEIFSQIAADANFIVTVANAEARSRHMGSISPHQRAHAPRKELTEYTLVFERGQ